MRLALFSDTVHDLNGVARFVNALAHEAHHSSREFVVFTSTHKRLYATTDRDIQIPNISNITPLARLPMPGYRDLDVVLPPRRALMNSVRDFKPDVIHVSTPGPVGWVGRSAARRLGVPLVGTYHTDFPAYAAHLFGHDSVANAARDAMAWFYKPFDMLLTRSDAYRESAVQFGVPTATLRAGVDTHRFTPARRDVRVWSHVPGALADVLTCLYVGRVSVEKNLPLLARVWPAIHDACAARGVPVQLVIVGDGPYRETLRRLLPMPSVVFAGVRVGDELADLYASSDLFVFPSRTDTLGQVVMEAQASGVPCVVGDLGGPRGIIDDGVTGLVASDDDRAWIDAVVSLMLDAPGRAAMGVAARERMESRPFSASAAHFWALHRGVVESAASRLVSAANNQA